MLFNSAVFLFVFLPITYLVFWALSTARSRYVWLTITGYVFYGYWNPWFTLLMLFSTVVSFTAGATLGFGSRSFLNLGVNAPVTGPQPYVVEAIAQLNIRY